MSFEQRDNSGALFRNDRATTDKHPTHKGTAMVDGIQYWISAWIKEGRDGGRFFSLAFEPKKPDDGAHAPAGARDGARQGQDSGQGRQGASRGSQADGGGAAGGGRIAPFDDDLPFAAYLKGNEYLI